MADRSALRLPRVRPSLDLGLNHVAARATALSRSLPRRPPTGQALALALWRGFWLPYWLGSDVPAPHLPARDQMPPAETGLAGEQVLRLLNRLTRRLWLLRALTILVRSVWLVTLVGSIWLLLERQGGPVFHGERLPPVAVVLVIIGVLFAALVRPTRRQVARMLDRSFGLHERMTTAVDNLGRAVPKEGERASVVYLQIADAANVVADLRGHPAFRLRLPVREIALGIAFALLMAALFFLRGVGGGIPPVSAGAVPAFVPAADRIAEEAAAAQAEAQAALAEAPTAAEVQERAELSNAARQDLQQLGEALDDHAVTRPAADAIQRGDYDGAADDLRGLAADADQLSPSARQELAEDLEQAAGEMSAGENGLAEASQAAADGLQQGEQAAEEGMRDLGDAVERTGDNVASQQELASEMRQAEAAEANGDQAQQGTEDGQQDQQGEQAGNQSDDPNQQGQPREGQPQDSQASGENGDAQSGESSEGQQEGQPGQQPGPGEGQPGAESGEGSEGSDQNTEGSGEPEAGGEPRPGGEPGQGESDQAGQGAGAGSGEQEPGQGETEAGPSGEEAGAEGAPPEERVTEAERSGDGAGETSPPPSSEAVQLPRSSGEGVQTSNNAGSSSIGSGTGVAAASGSTVQQEVGEGGPDSNRVPPTYRSVVEEYFSDPSDRS